MERFVMNKYETHPDSYVHATLHTKVLLSLNELQPNLEYSVLETLYLDRRKVSLRPDVLGREDEENVLAAEVSTNNINIDLKVLKAFYELIGVKDYVLINGIHNKIYHFRLNEDKYEELSSSELANALSSKIFKR